MTSLNISKMVHRTQIVQGLKHQPKRMERAHFLRLDKDSWENIPPMVFKSFQTTNTNMLGAQENINHCIRVGFNNATFAS